MGIKSSMNETLVLYSSGLGSTKEVATEIANVLFDYHGQNVTLQSIDDCKKIKQYNSIIIGTSVRADKPLANVRDFFAIHRWDMADKNLALFFLSFSGINHLNSIEVYKKEYTSQLLCNYPWINLTDTALFGGKIDFTRLNPVMLEFVKRIMKQKGLSPQASIDGRDWHKITGWAKHISHSI